VDAGHKLVLSEEPDGERAELYRLGREDVDLAASSPELLRSLRDRLLALRQALPAARGETPQALSAEDRARLRALGYQEPVPE
jgi:hypothetical protein